MLSILLVDDEHLVLDMLVREIGWEKLSIGKVFTAHSAKEAMGVLARQPVDIILCDIEMPQKSGLELLRDMKENQIGTVCILLTAHADFRYAREAVSLGAIEYITKPAPVAQLEEAIARAAERVQALRKSESDAENGRKWAASHASLLRHFWADVVSGSVGPDRADLAAERSARCIETPLEDQYMLLQLALRLPSDDRSGLSEGELIRVVQDVTMGMTGAEAVTEPRSGTWTAILRGTGEEHLREREEMARNLLDTLNEHQQLYLMGCLIDGVKPEDIREQIRRAYRRVHDRVDEDRLLVFPGPLRPVPEQGERQESYRQAPFDAWQQMLKGQQAEKLIAQVYDFLFSLDESGPLPEQVLSGFLHDYLQMIYSVLKEEGIQSADLFRMDDALQPLMERATSGLNDLRFFCGMISGRCTQLMAAARDELSVSEQIRRYVVGHLGEELSRDSIAAHVGFSPEYVSRLFKQETGLNLVNYVQNERMHAACGLLLSSDMSVSEIAAQLGYDNFAYFSKAFRKYTGVTPSAYRKGAPGPG